MSDDAFFQSLPTKRMSAGALFFDAQGRVLLVNPTYKEVWEIPGGVVEQDESPHDGCVREVQEELGLAVKRPLRLLCVDYNSPIPGKKTESVVFIFYGGQLSPRLIDQIQLPPDELSEYRFCTEADARARLSPRLGRRLSYCLAHLHETSYLEDQHPI